MMLALLKCGCWHNVDEETTARVLASTKPSDLVTTCPEHGETLVVGWSPPARQVAA